MRLKPDTQKAHGVTKMYRAYRVKSGDKTTHFNTYRSVCYEFNKIMMDKVINEQLDWYFPHNIGLLIIRKAHKTSLTSIIKPINWPETLLHKKHIFLENHHTNGYIYKFHWVKRGMRIRGQRVYMFKPTTLAGWKLAKVLKDPNRTFDYIKRK